MPKENNIFEKLKYINMTDYTETIVITDNNNDGGETNNEAYRRKGEDEPTTLDDYLLIEEVGSGAQGKVYKARRKRDGKLIALKILHIRPESAKYNRAIQEINALEEVSYPRCSPYLACYYDHSYDPSQRLLLIEMEYITGDTLDKYAKRLYEHEEYDKLYRHLVAIAKDIAVGLEVFHDKGIIHNDIKPENIIIDTNMVPKLVDFGISCKTGIDTCSIEINSQDKDIECCKTLSGTIYYMPPELLDHIRYKSSDIWSLGITLYHSATGGKYPYDFPEQKNFKNIAQTITLQEPKELITNNQKLNYIVNQALQIDPLKRILPNEIISI